MTRDSRTPAGRESIDDAAIALLVRDVAADWTMPPVRLDAPSWRDRVRSPRARRVAGAWGLFGRVGQAATAAIALTVVGALVAVVITHPPQDAAKSPEPSAKATPGSTNGAPASLLPKLFIDGELPAPLDLLVRTERGDFATVDLRAGSIGGALTGGRHGSEVWLNGDGSVLCLCLAESGNVNGFRTRAEVTLDRYDADGKLASTTPIESFSGEPDPRDTGKVIPERPPHVLTALGFSTDGSLAFVGWSARAHPAWKSGIVVVDSLDASVVSRLELPDGSTGGANSRRVVGPPRVVGSTRPDRLLIARSWYEWSPPESDTASFTYENDVFRVTFSGGQWSDLAPVPTASDCGDVVTRGGGLADGGAWLECSGGGSAQTIVRRLAADGSWLGDARVSGEGGIVGETTALSPDGKSLFAWDPATATLTKVDLGTGATSKGRGPTARVDAGPLAAFGAWLAPSAAAKSLLSGGVVVSPDGSRVYGIGIGASGASYEMSGSTGVFAFDAATLASVGHYPPTADFVSLAVSRDGRFVYAAGLPGVDAAGNLNGRLSASITVFSTADGSIRLIAGQLGSGLITFGSPTLD